MLRKFVKSRAYFNAARTFLAIAAAIALTLILILVVSKTPGQAIQYFLLGPLKKSSRLANVVEVMLPLIFTGLAVSLINRTGIFNLASEGSFFMGGTVAALAVLHLNLPPVLLPIVSILLAGLASAVCMLIPVVIKLRFNASEIVSSLMLNYVLFFLGCFLIRVLARNPDSGDLESLPFSKAAILPQVVPDTRIHAGVLIALACILVLWVYLYKSRWGYKMRMVGSNKNFALYSGISTAAAVLIAQALAGFVCGLGGASEVLGMYSAFRWRSMPGYGWDGIIVATLARNNPAMVPLGAFFLAYMRVGADIMTRMSDVPNEIVSVIQGVVIILLVADGFLAGWDKKRVFQETTANLVLGGEGSK